MHLACVLCMVCLKINSVQNAWKLNTTGRRLRQGDLHEIEKEKKMPLLLFLSCLPCHVQHPNAECCQHMLIFTLNETK